MKVTIADNGICYLCWTESDFVQKVMRHFYQGTLENQYGEIIGLIHIEFV